MGLVGSRSAMLIMREALYGTSRFDDFVSRVEMAPATASTHLRALTEAGLLMRQPYREPGGRTRDEYALTPAGADFRPVIVALFEWGRRHAGINPLVEFAHDGCGQRLGVQVRCAAGHEVPAEETALRPVGPAAGAPVDAVG
jgi:DNA-binding HxlR family transcriptional regulator